MIEIIKNQAILDNVPIMSDETIEVICNQIEIHHYRDILELGTAIGYSSLMIAKQCPWVKIDTIEKDPQRHEAALKNKTMLDDDQITMILHDAKTWPITKFYDLVIIDAAKAQNKALFERVFPFVKDRGMVIVDNMDFHGHVLNIPKVKNRRNLRQMVEKIAAFKVWIASQEHLVSKMIDVGDGLMIIQRK